MSQGMHEGKKKGSRYGSSDIPQKRITCQAGGTSAEFVRDDGCGGGCWCDDTDKSAFRCKNVQRFQEQINENGATDLDEQQPEVYGFEPEIAERDFTESQQQHRKDEIRCQKRQMDENRIEMIEQMETEIVRERQEQEK